MSSTTTRATRTSTTKARTTSSNSDDSSTTDATSTTDTDQSTSTTTSIESTTSSDDATSSSIFSTTRSRSTFATSTTTKSPSIAAALTGIAQPTATITADTGKDKAFANSTAQAVALSILGAFVLFALLNLLWWTVLRCRRRPNKELSEPLLKSASPVPTRQIGGASPFLASAAAHPQRKPQYIEKSYVRGHAPSASTVSNDSRRNLFYDGPGRGFHAVSTRPSQPMPSNLAGMNQARPPRTASLAASRKSIATVKGSGDLSYQSRVNLPSSRQGKGLPTRPR